MTLITNNMPVELLRDGRGIYGVGVTDEFDYEAMAWACGVDPREVYIKRTPRSLILRPDRFEPLSRAIRYDGGAAVLQMIPGGFRRGAFKSCIEEALRQHIHHEALKRAGLSGPGSTGELKWWSTDKAEQCRNRKMYHGLRRLSLNVINRLICEAIEAAAHPDAIRTARRFYLRDRQAIYRAGATSKRAMQLANVFPFAALCLYTNHSWIDRGAIPDWMAHHDASQKAMAAARRRRPGRAWRAAARRGGRTGNSTGVPTHQAGRRTPRGLLADQAA
jgi:hypothetical protein